MSSLLLFVLFAAARTTHACYPLRNNDNAAGGTPAINRAGSWCHAANRDYTGYFIPLQSRQCDVQNPIAEAAKTQVCDESYRTCNQACSSDADCVIQTGDTQVKQSCLGFMQRNTFCSYFSGGNSPAEQKQCGCTNDAQCLSGERCRDGLCVCYSFYDCTRSGQVCLFGQRSWNEISQNAGYTETSLFGQCFCNPYLNMGCSGNGDCVFRQDENNIAHATWQLVPNGGMTRAGVCQCYKGWAGRFCQDNVAKRVRCSGHGTPLCTKALSSSDLPAVSKNTGLSTGLYECTYKKTGWQNDWNASPRPGELGCLCDAGYEPDTGEDGSKFCWREQSCAAGGGKQVGAISSDGYCRCYADYFDKKFEGLDLIAKPGRCSAGCGALICSGHGSCVATADSGSFNAACECDAGWMTAPITDQVINANRRDFQYRKYCDMPYEVIEDAIVPCGYYGKIGDNGQCALNPIYSSYSSEFTLDAITGLYVRSCPKPKSGPFQGQPCSGPVFGQCVSDGHKGTQCQCNNGFTGTDCRSITCPSYLYANGMVCSGNGYCDNATPNVASNGRCICKQGYFGDACERRVIDCAQSQPVYTLQSQQPLIPDILTQLATL